MMIGSVWQMNLLYRLNNFNLIELKFSKLVIVVRSSTLVIIVLLRTIAYSSILIRTIIYSKE